MKVTVCRRAQLQLLLFAKTSLKDAIDVNSIESSAENTGFLHVLPNKVLYGAVFLGSINDIVNWV